MLDSETADFSFVLSSQRALDAAAVRSKPTRICNGREIFTQSSREISCQVSVGLISMRDTILIEGKVGSKSGDPKELKCVLNVVAPSCVRCDHLFNMCIPLTCIGQHAQASASATPVTKSRCSLYCIPVIPNENVEGEPLHRKHFEWRTQSTYRSVVTSYNTQSSLVSILRPPVSISPAEVCHTHTKFYSALNFWTAENHGVPAKVSSTVSCHAFNI